MFSEERVRAQVLRVIDGDTIIVELRGTSVPPVLSVVEGSVPSDTSATVRLLGIDAPESLHPFKALERYGPEATAFLRSLLEGREVEMEVEGQDSYGRTLGSVFLEGRDVQVELIRRGLALVEVRFPFARMAEYLVYEEGARGLRVGVWSGEGVEEEILAEREKIVVEGGGEVREIKEEKSMKEEKEIKEGREIREGVEMRELQEKELVRRSGGKTSKTPLHARKKVSTSTHVQYRNVVKGKGLRSQEEMKEEVATEEMPQVYQDLLALAVRPQEVALTSLPDPNASMSRGEVLVVSSFILVGVGLCAVGKKWMTDCQNIN